MSRKSLYICVTCLLYLLPALSFAQSLTLYEYWFDDDFANRIPVSLSGANAVVKTDIDANQLDNGVNFMAAVTICSDFGAQKNKVSHCFHCFPIYFP